MTHTIVVRNADGICSKIEVSTEYLQNLIPTEEVVTLRGWGQHSGRARAYTNGSSRSRFLIREPIADGTR